MVYDVNPIDEDEHAECRREIKRLKTRVRHLSHITASQCSQCDGYWLTLPDGANECRCESTAESESKPLPFYDGLAVHIIKRSCGFAVNIFFRIMGGPDKNPTKFQKWCRSGEFIGWGRD